MKKILTVLLFVFVCYGYSQEKEIYELDRKSSELKAEFRQSQKFEIKKNANSIKQLSAEIEKLQDSIEILRLDNKQLVQLNNVQAERITLVQNELDQLRKIDSITSSILKNKMEILQTFIRDTLEIVCSCPDNGPIENNLLAELDFNHDAWLVNTDGSYTYDASASYKYLRFLLTEPLEVDQDYKIVFSIQNNDSSRRALINFWAYVDPDDGSDVVINHPGISSDIYYEDGDHEYEFKVEGRNRFKLAIRARNNDGGAFTINNLKVIKL